MTTQSPSIPLVTLPSAPATPTASPSDGGDPQSSIALTASVSAINGSLGTVLSTDSQTQPATTSQAQTEGYRFTNWRTLTFWLKRVAKILVACGGLAAAYAAFSLSIWTSIKDYREDCRSQNITRGLLTKECRETLAKSLRPPPFFSAVDRRNTVERHASYRHLHFTTPPIVEGMAVLLAFLWFLGLYALFTCTAKQRNMSASRAANDESAASSTSWVSSNLPRLVPRQKDQSLTHTANALRLRPRTLKGSVSDDADANLRYGILCDFANLPSDSEGQSGTRDIFPENPRSLSNLINAEETEDAWLPADMTTIRKHSSQSLFEGTAEQSRDPYPDSASEDSNSSNVALHGSSTGSLPLSTSRKWLDDISDIQSVDTSKDARFSKTPRILRWRILPHKWRELPLFALTNRTRSKTTEQRKGDLGDRIL